MLRLSHGQDGLAYRLPCRTSLMVARPSRSGHSQEVRLVLERAKRIGSSARYLAGLVANDHLEPSVTMAGRLSCRAAGQKSGSGPPCPDDVRSCLRHARPRRGAGMAFLVADLSAHPAAHLSRRGGWHHCGVGPSRHGRGLRRCGAGVLGGGILPRGQHGGGPGIWKAGRCLRAAAPAACGTGALRRGLGAMRLGTGHPVPGGGADAARLRRGGA